MHDSNLPDHSCRLRRRSSAFHATSTNELQSVSKREPRQPIRSPSALGGRHQQLSAIAALRLRLSELHLSPQQALDLIAQETVALANADGTAIAIASGEAVVCCARAGDLGPPLGTPIDAHSGLSGECLRSGEVVCCDDTETDPRVELKVCRQSAIRSVLAVPLRFDEQVIGILVALSARRGAFGYWEARLLQLLADLASEPHISGAPPGGLSQTETCLPISAPCIAGILPSKKSAVETENATAAANANTVDNESHKGLFPSGRWAPARSRHISQCLETIRQDPALRLLGRAKAYLTIETLHDGIDRSHPIALFEELMLRRVAEIGVAVP